MDSTQRPWTLELGCGSCGLACSLPYRVCPVFPSRFGGLQYMQGPLECSRDHRGQPFLAGPDLPESACCRMGQRPKGTHPPSLPVPRPLPPRIVQHSQSSLVSRASISSTPWSRLGGPRLLISLFFGGGTLRPWVVNMAPLLLGSAAHGYNVAIGRKTRKRKVHKPPVFNWHCPPVPVSTYRHSRGSVWAARAGLPAIHSFRLT